MIASKLFFKILKSKKKGIFLYILLFTGIFLLILSQVKSEMQQSLEKQKLNILLIDQDQSSLSKGLGSFILDNNKSVKIEGDQEKIKDAIFENRLDYGIIIAKGFEKTLEQEKKVNLEIITGIDQQKTDLIDRKINSYLSIYQNYISFFGETPSQEDREFVAKEMKKALEVDVEGELIKMDQSPSQDLTLYNLFLRFMDYIIIATSFFAIGGVVTKMENAKVKKREGISGISQRRRAASVFLSCFVFTSLLWLVLVAIGLLFTSTSLLGNSLTYWMLFSSYIHAISFTSFVLFVSQLARSEKAVGFFSTLLSLAISFGTGIFISRKFIWKPLLDLTMVVPTGWDIKNLYAIERSIDIGGKVPAKSLMESLLIMAFMALVFFLLTIIIRNIQSKEEG